MRAAATIATVLLMAVSALAAGPNPTPTPSLATFRVTAAEVHVTFTAVSANNEPVTDLTLSDFVLLRDGNPIDSIVSFRSYDEQPLSVLVLTDVSDSMQPGLQLNRAATDWLRQHAGHSSDKISFLDFGAEVENAATSFHNRHMTSLFDALMETLPTLQRNDSQRHALILLTDGIDNYSFHSLQDVIALAQRDDIAVYAVTAHPEKKQYYSPEILQKLCNATGGKYYDVRRPDAMLAAMADIDRELRSGFEVIFRPDAAAGLHQLKLEATDPRLHFFYRSAYFQPAARSNDELAAGE